MKGHARITPGLVLGILVLGTMALTGCDEGIPGDEWEGDGVVALMGGLVFTSPDTDPVEDGVVVVLEGVIEAVGERGQVQIPPAARRVDASGLSVLPGFWNADVWVDDELLELAEAGSDDELTAALRERFSRFGFTTVVETGSSVEELAPLLDRLDDPGVRGPRILPYGSGLPATVQPGGWVPGGEGGMGSEEARDLAQRGVALIPSLTLASIPEEGERGESVAARVSVAVDAVGAFVRAGGRLVFGTGAGYIPEFGPSTELVLLEDAGISFEQLLASLTLEPAVRFGDGYTGLIEPGMTADLVLVQGDPGSDRSALDRVVWAMRDGYTIYSSR